MNGRESAMEYDENWDGRDGQSERDREREQWEDSERGRKQSQQGGVKKQEYNFYPQIRSGMGGMAAPTMASGVKSSFPSMGAPKMTAETPAPYKKKKKSKQKFAQSKTKPLPQFQGQSMGVGAAFNQPPMSNVAFNPTAGPGRIESLSRGPNMSVNGGGYANGYAAPPKSSQGMSKPTDNVLPIDSYPFAKQQPKKKANHYDKRF
jgi:hypothetical protein